MSCVSALRKFTGRPREKVIGTGTLLDTARLRRFAAGILKIQPQNVTTCVLGEHGNSSIIVWSWTRILGMDIPEFLKAELKGDLKIGRDKLLEIERGIGDDIYEKKGSTSYGVAAATAQITSAILYDTHEILPVSVYLDGEYGISGISMSVPCYVSRNGAEPINVSTMSEDEMKGLRASAEVIREFTEKFV